MERIYAVVLAAGNGSRMGGSIAKQYRLLGGKPVICHTLAAFEESVVDGVVLVVQAGTEEYAQAQIVRKYGFRKVKSVVGGGRERCDSVYAGMRCIRAGMGEEDCAEGVVLVHDGARPFVTPELIARMAGAAERQACAIPAVPVKDTIRQVRSGFVEETLDRSALYAVQTPQAFRFSVLWDAFEAYAKRRGKAPGQAAKITDDAMLVECMLGRRAALEPGDYRNIKLTTPEDMLIARAFLEEKEQGRPRGRKRHPNAMPQKQKERRKFRRQKPGK